MKTSSTSDPAKCSSEEKTSTLLTKIFDVPLVSQFYEPPDVPQIINSKTKLKCASTWIYVLTAVAFALLVYQGLTTVQKVSVTVIAPLPFGSEDGFVCKNLGRYTGTPYQCSWDGPPIVNSICNPPSPPVNCPNGIVDCPAAPMYFYSSGTGWKINMKNVYFESFADCVRKVGTVLNDTIASPTSYAYNAGQQVDLTWPSYKGPIRIGDNTAEFQVALTFSLRSQSGDPFISTGSSNGTCASDSTNFNSDGSVISNSAVDIFVKSLPGHLLRSGYSGGPNCPVKPIPDNICQPFQTIGPYSCTKTTKITQPILQVLGSSFSNATTLMTVLSIVFAWIIQKGDKKTLNSTESVAPNANLSAAKAEPSN